MTIAAVVGKGGPPPLPCNECSSFFGRAGTLDLAHKNAYGDLICGLAADGVWQKLDTLYVFAAPSQAVALLNLVQTNPTAVNHGCTFTIDLGFTGDGVAAYIDTNYNPVLFPPHKQTQNSATMFGWCNTMLRTGGAYFRGEASGVGQSFLFFSGDNIHASIKVNQNVGGATIAATGYKGLWSGSRTGANALAFYLNGALGATDASPSSTLVNANVTFLKGQGAFSGAQILAGGDGAALTAPDNASLYAHLHTYLQAIAGIP